ncbi:unnamed protein product [Larinioides sclopetarius]|uniref:BTB domain-containing protein n=1 Tax=Larinioides sclopetarius TaxID=280406 RepID=A0AAV2AJ02_9ARAC
MCVCVCVFEGANQFIRREFLLSDDKKLNLFTLPFSKNVVIARKDLCLLNDVLSLRCECTYTTGDIIEEIESVICDCDSLSSIEADNQWFEKENTFSISEHVLNDDLKSMFHDNIFSDIKLKTSTKTFSAHKSILSGRSPVFKAMFSNNMKEKLMDCVEIKDIDSETAFRMLRYVYTAEIKDLQWEGAFGLYRAADKYQILSLRDECSAYFKSNLRPNNACDVLVLADAHQDEELKASVQEFIFNNGIINSDEWNRLMNTHVKLAADTMYLQIQRKTSKFPDNKFSTTEQLFENRSSRLNSVPFCFGSTTTKTTSTSLVLNSNTTSKPFQPSFSFGKSSIDKSSAPSVLKFSSSQTPSACSRPGYSEGGSSWASHGFNSNKTEFPAEFGMKSDRAPFAAPRQSTMERYHLHTLYVAAVLRVRLQPLGSTALMQKCLLHHLI